MGDFITMINTTFAMVSHLFTNTISRVRWYIDNGASQHMTTYKFALFRLEEQDTNMQWELSDDGKCLVTGMGIISFHKIPTCNKSLVIMASA